jgi:NDP-sugar pyrophosphorylase family protein
MKGMILAAGHGTRLRPLTLALPKVMVPIDGRPLLEHTIAWLRDHGITDIGVNLHFMPDVITGHFGDGSRFGVRMRYSLEDELRGTAGGVKRLQEFLDETFVLVYGDVLTDLDLNPLFAFHRGKIDRPHLTMALYRVSNPTECGIVSIAADGRIDRFVEKPSRDHVFSDLASAGVLVVDPDAVRRIPEGVESDFGRDMFPRYIDEGFPMFGWQIPEGARLVDVGSNERYAAVRNSWSRTTAANESVSASWIPASSGAEAPSRLPRGGRPG